MLSSQLKHALLLLIAFALPAFGYVPEWIPKNSVNLQDVRRICVGDLNGDGRPDVVTRRNGANSIHVMLTQADGSLGQTSLAGSGTDVALADVNGDGKLDLIIADSETKRLIAAPGKGDGTFGAQVATTLSIAPDELAAGDFDGDGRSEILVRTTSGPQFAIFKADGNLQFSSLSSMPLNSSLSKLLVGDADGDGKADVVVAYARPAGLVVHYGKGDGTFEQPVPIAGSTAASDDVTLADLNGDGRPDVVTCEAIAGTVTVIRNNGGRQFAPPVSYDAHTSKSDPYPYSVLVFDATDDGKPDVVAVAGGYSGVLTFAGNGDGTLLPPVVDFSDNFTDAIVASADLTGDGRPDLIVSLDLSVVLMRTAPGEAMITVTPQYPTISAGQSDSYLVVATSAVPVSPSSVVPKGSVTVLRDGVPVGTGTLVGGFLTIGADTPPLGTHELTVSFPGNADFRPVTSAPTALHVVNETTTITLANDHAGQTVPYGTEYLVTGSITSSIPGPLTGVTRLYTDGQRTLDTDMYPPDLVWRPFPPPGTHTFFVKYEGDATHPPSQSNTVTQVIEKGFVQVHFVNAVSSANYGDQPSFTVSFDLVFGYHGLYPAGNVHIYDGKDLLLTFHADGNNFSQSFQMPPLPAGVHMIQAVYEGDDRYNGNASGFMQYTVVAPSVPLPPKKRSVHH